MSLDERIAAALDAVHDPCSVAAGRPMGLMRMGLVVDWTWPSPDRLRVRFCVTSPTCTMAPHFTLAARDALEAVVAPAAVEVVIDPGFEWMPDRIAQPI